MNALQPIERQVCVDLRGRDIGVAEDGLNSSEVGAVFDHVRGATVSQHVRTGVPARALRRPLHDLPHPLPREAFGSPGDKDLCSVLPTGQQGSPIMKIGRKHLLRRTPERDHPILISLTAHDRISKVELQILHLYVYDLGHAQPTGIHHFEHGAIARRHRQGQLFLCNGPLDLDQVFHLCPRKRLRQDLPLLRRVDVERGIVLDISIQKQIPVKVPQSRQFARHRTAIHFVRQQRVQKLLHVVAAHSCEVALASRREFRKLVQIAEIGFNAQLRQALLYFQVVGK